ncbi:transposase, Mutator family protein [Mycobacterium ulcerans str. Harvey]|uniref:Transposase, Mutator family protein n=1 Tax=Mycobacterium ulcerans str. Harvey TaxID=1299332 RepID=A0ABN0RAA8_MYCUL|nr:transposase, Mutator family protein [Mycobacterium ulcerans str. Harvey]
MLTELKNRGVADIFFLVCDGLKGLPDSVRRSPRHRGANLHHPLDPRTFRYAGASTTPRSPGAQPIYTAVNAAAAPKP